MAPGDDPLGRARGSFLSRKPDAEVTARMLAQFADNIWFVAAAWMGLALLASLSSIRLGVSVALIEIGMGVIGGNFPGFQTTPWIDFLATFGSGLLTFLAGAEIEPESLRRSQANTGDRLAVFLNP